MHHLLLYALLYFLNYSLSAHNEYTESIHKQQRIGIIAMFPEKTGLFFHHRAFLFENKKQISLFPEKDVSFNFSINQEIASTLQTELQKTDTKKQLFVPLPSLVPEKNLTGYAIEGWWGVKTNRIFVKGLQPFFDKKKLDSIIAIVPVTYYAAPMKSEGTGMNLLFVKNQLYFFVNYAVLIFSKSSSHHYKKTYSSIKQTYFISEKSLSPLNNKKYGQQDIDLYYQLFQKNFLPHLQKQVFLLLKDKSNSSIFSQPQKPFHYYLPH